MAAMGLPEFAAACTVGAIAGLRGSPTIGRLRARCTARYCEWCFHLGKSLRKRLGRRASRR
jgi:hypothetical protein